MDNWLYILILIGVFITTNGIIFYSINRQLKKVEVKEKEIEVIKKQDDEWLELYREEKLKREEFENKCKEFFEELEDLRKEKGCLELKTQLLNWYICTVNSCKHRKPPHVFDINGNELESRDEKL